ncbi:hypothetical protein RFC90_003817 [Klebsiella aerogenes]|nr:hypothetical protein [Klebsiella aerogenes]HCI6421249.1 hypothetical protein [Klebsiella quasipneumoniae subsp. similipneumoniae]
MKKTYFTHSNLNAEEVRELKGRYQAQGVRVEVTLSADNRSFMLAALLPESANPPKPSKTFQNRVWG